MANPPRSGTTAGSGNTPGSGRLGGGATHGAGATAGGGATRGPSPSYGGGVHDAGSVPGGSQSPDAGAVRGGAASKRSGGKAVRMPRKAQKIKWSPQEIKESQAGRWALAGFVGVVLVLGVIGWSWYLTLPAPPVLTLPALMEPGPSSLSRQESAAPAGGSQAAEGRRRGASAGSTRPIDLTPKELREEIMSHAPQPADQAYAMYYQGREVTWTGHVVGTHRHDQLLRVDLRDGDGLRVVAWCESGAEPTSGTRVTVRGRVTTKLADGFVVERCEIQ
jgi:hypothetical protein